MSTLHRFTAAGIGLGLSALLLTGCGTAEAESLPGDEAAAAMIPSGPSDLELEKAAADRAAAEAKTAAEAEAARLAADQAAAEVARIAAEQAAAEAVARAAAEEDPARPDQQSNRPGGTQTAPKPGGTAPPRPAPAPAPAAAPEPSNPYTAANFTGATLLSCNADNTTMTIRMNFTSGSYTVTGPNGSTGTKLPSGEWVNIMVECGM